MTDNYIKNKLSIITQEISDALLKQKRPEEPTTLYMLYYNTANWQKTNQPKCTTYFAAKKLHWGVRKVRRAKKALISLGLIEDVRAVHPKTKKVIGYYIKLNYKFKAKNESKVSELMKLNAEFTCSKTSSAVKRAGAADTTNALSNNNLNAYSSVSIVSKKKKKTNNVENSTYCTKNKNVRSNNKSNNKRESYNSIIAGYAKGNAEISDLLKEFVQMRCATNKLLTNVGFEKILQRLDRFSDGSDMAKAEILSKSIRKSCPDVYPLSEQEWDEVHAREYLDMRINRPKEWALRQQQESLSIDEKLRLWREQIENSCYLRCGG